MAGTDLKLRYPAENCVRNDFITCLIEDEYGLWRSRFEARTIVDIGGTVGFFSVAARARYPHAAIHCYEPNARVIGYLRENISTIGVEVFHGAVGATQQLVEVVDCGDSNLTRTRPVFEDGPKIRQVSFSRVVDRLPGSVDLVKMDCERAEWEIFEDLEAWNGVKDSEWSITFGEGGTTQTWPRNSMTWALVSRATSRVAIGERFGYESSSCFRSRT